MYTGFFLAALYTSNKVLSQGIKYWMLFQTILLVFLNAILKKHGLYEKVSVIRPIFGVKWLVVANSLILNCFFFFLTLDFILFLASGECDVLTSYLGLRDEQLSPPGGRGSCEEKKEEKGGWPLFRGISWRQVTRVNSKIKYIFILFLPGPYLS